MMNYAKKMPMPKKGQPKPKEADMAMELEVEPEGEEAPMDLKAMMAEGGEGKEASPLADVPDEELMAEMKKRGLMPEGAAAPESAKPPMMK